MKRLLRIAFAATVLVTALGSAAEAEPMTVGVFLPTTLADGQQRFDYGEKLAAALGTALGNQPFVARNFARFADFQEAVKAGKIDVAVVDAWIAAETPETLTPVALVSMGGATKRKWALVSKPGRTVGSLMGKPLALTRGAGTADANFASNAVFEGALVADKALAPTYAPSVESALKMWSLGNADAVVVPAPLAPAEGKILYQSSALPIAAVMVPKARVDTLKKALLGLSPIAPFDAFSANGTDEIAALRRLIANGPPSRPPVWSDAPPLPIDLKGLVTWKGFSPVMPSLTDLASPGKELPDD